MNKVPAWYKLTWFLGRPPDLSQHQWKVLGLVAAVSFFEQYDIYLFLLNLKQIQAELQMAESELGFLGAVVRAGSLAAILLALAADRVGRRIMLLVTVLGYTFFTGATALAPSAEAFVAFQFFARAFGSAEVVLAAVVIAEEFAPEHRGWGIGALGALQACGAGFAAIMFGFVDDIPYGWRTLYAIGIVPLFFIAYWRRSLPETQRFESLEKAHQPLLRPVGELLVKEPRRTYGLFVAVMAYGLAASTAAFFAPKYLQDVHGWTPGNVALLTVAGGAFAIVGSPLAGWLSDRFGRRPVTVIFTTFVAVAGITFYSAIGVFIPLLWIFMIFFVLGADVTTTSYATELFPTRYRYTATGMRQVISNGAAIIGLAAISALYAVVGSNWVAISIVCAAALFAPVIVWMLLPETAGKTLEEIAPD